MICFLGPAPQNCLPFGYSLRVLGIDSLFSKTDRIYIDFSSDPSRWTSDATEKENTTIRRVILDPSQMRHRELCRRILAASSLIYAHSIYRLEPIAEFLNDPALTQKLVTDLHGVVPEEAVLLGDRTQSISLGILEKTTIEKSALLIMVTHSMKEHFRKKYPFSSFLSAYIPIFKPNFPFTKPLPLSQDALPLVIYAGGLEPWQNVEKMIATVALTYTQFRFRFLVYDQSKMKLLCRKHGVLNKIEFDQANTPNELQTHYQAAQFGFILRNPDLINRVACPTKLVDYLHSGIIPVVLTPEIGDFQELGFQYVTWSDFCAGNLPSEIQREEMIVKNHEVIQKMISSIPKGLKDIKDRFLDLEHKLEPNFETFFAHDSAWINSLRKKYVWTSIRHLLKFIKHKMLIGLSHLKKH